MLIKFKNRESIATLKRALKRADSDVRVILNIKESELKVIIFERGLSIKREFVFELEITYPLQIGSLDFLIEPNNIFLLEMLKDSYSLVAYKENLSRIKINNNDTNYYLSTIILNNRSGNRIKFEQICFPGGDIVRGI